jgi:hypothetical protein
MISNRTAAALAPHPASDNYRCREVCPLHMLPQRSGGPGWRQAQHGPEQTLNRGTTQIDNLRVD